MSPTPRCADCRFAQRIPPPGNEPKRPDGPKGWWARLWFDHDRAHWDWLFTEAKFQDAKNAHENLIRCVRMPEKVTKRCDDWCGEHQERTAL